MEDKITEDTIKLLIDGFYRKIRRDSSLAPIFERAIGTTDAEWQPHLEVMYAFWSSVMLNTGRYKGNPMGKHMAIPSFDIGLFDRWLALFAETAHEMHVPDIAARYVEKSSNIARSLKYGLYPDQVGRPG